MTTPETFNQSIAHITDGDHVFQVLSEDGTDWDEAATRAQYEAWIAAGKPVVTDHLPRD